MASLFRKRLRCFYCGVRSSRPTKGRVSEWKCPDCQAMNYLDEKGEITDPPVADASTNTRPTQYALPLPRPQPEAALESSSQSAYFCSTCLKNQHLLTQTLAVYLPPPSHPDYEAYEASYPAYRKSLEERYPQVCKNCEPRIRERIRQTGYEAKADHLRRMMEQSKNGKAARSKRSWKWRNLVVFAGAVSSWASVTGQLAWNIVGAISTRSVSAGTQMDVPSPLLLLRSCLSYAMKQSPMPIECRTTVQPYAGVALMLGALSVWWNPKLTYKVEGRPGRLTGLREYYRIQIVVLVMRFIAWAFLQDDLIMDLNPNLDTVVHVLVGGSTVIGFVISRFVIKFDTNPLVTWQDNVGPLLQKRQQNSETQLVTPPDSQESEPDTGSKVGTSFERFPIANLAAAPQREISRPSYARLTPHDDSIVDNDAMDWTPSQEEFQPNVNSASQLAQSQPAPSVFQGNLPPAPKPPSWQLRTQNQKPAPQPVQSNPNPFHNVPGSQPTPLHKDNTTESSERREVTMAAPKFFPPSDRRADTGLESLFDRTFSLADKPSEVRKKQSFAAEDQETMLAPGCRTSYMLKCGLLSITLMMLAGTQFSSLPRNTVETTVLAACFLVAGFSLLESLMRPMGFWSVMDFLFPGLELVACVYLTVTRPYGTDYQLQFDRIAKGLAAFMLVQELMALRSSLTSTASFNISKSNASERQEAEKSLIDSSPAHSAQQTASVSELRDSSYKPQSRHVASSGHNIAGNNQSTRFHAPTPGPNQAPSSFKPLDTTNRNYPQAPAPLSRYNNQSFQNNFNGAANIVNNNNLQQPMPYPSPFSSFSRPPVDASLSFSSFGSAAPEKVLSTASTASTTDYACSNPSEPPSPQQTVRQTTPGSTTTRRSARSPSITGLTLDDSPVRPRMPRYSLRNRRT